MKEFLLSKTLLDIIDLQRPILLGGISLHRKKKSWLSLRLVSPKRQSQSKELANWHTSLNQSKPSSRQSLAAYSIPKVLLRLAALTRAAVTQRADIAKRW